MWVEIGDLRLGVENQQIKYKNLRKTVEFIESFESKFNKNYVLQIK